MSLHYRDICKEAFKKNTAWTPEDIGVPLGVVKLRIAENRTQYIKQRLDRENVLVELFEGWCQERRNMEGELQGLKVKFRQVWEDHWRSRTTR